jgi:hypothetical protein
MVSVSESTAPDLRDLGHKARCFSQKGTTNATSVDVRGIPRPIKTGIVTRLHPGKAKGLRPFCKAHRFSRKRVNGHCPT